MPANAPASAAVLLIGDELLSGKIRDENGPFLAKMLRRRGVRLVEMCVVADDPVRIGAALLRLSQGADLVFTSGGVGPTHDDRTLEAIAAATGRPLRRNAEMEAQLRKHYRGPMTDAALAMADLPEGTLLRAMPGWPVLRMDLSDLPEVPGATRIYILPGVPPLLRAKIEQLEGIEGELPRGQGWHLTELLTTTDESRLAPELARLSQAHPDVDIGSYPSWHRGEGGKLSYHVRVTFEAPNEYANSAVEACDALRATLPADSLLPRAPL